MCHAGATVISLNYICNLVAIVMLLWIMQGEPTQWGSSFCLWAHAQCECYMGKIVGSVNTRVEHFDSNIVLSIASTVCKDIAAHACRVGTAHFHFIVMRSRC